MTIMSTWPRPKMLSNAASQCITTAIGARKTKSVFQFLLFLQIMFFCVGKTGVILCFYWMVFFFQIIKINPDARSHWLRAAQVSVREAGLCPTKGSPVTGITRGGIVLGSYPKQLVNYKTSFGLHYTLCTYFEVFRQQLPGWSWTNRTWWPRQPLHKWWGW